MTSKTVQELLFALQESLNDGSFVKFTLGNYKGAEEDLQNIHIRRILIKKQDHLSFTFRHKTRDIVKNYSPGESFSRIQKFIEGDFGAAMLFTTSFNLAFDAKGKALKKSTPTSTEAPSADHDRAKNRLIRAENQPYLYALGITDETGTVLKNAQDKYRQINRYVEILSTLIKDIPAENLKNFVDMGAGKGYLTFALYDYLTTTLKLSPRITGVEQRADLVALGNKTAQESGFKNLEFVEGSINDHDCTCANVLIALHACDTATDDAIAKGIKAGADLIVVAPCCHKQIRREMETNKAHNDLDFLMKHGIFVERQAEMVTDGLRALILEYSGYAVKIFEFISDSHTPKNIMIVATKSARPPKRDTILKQIQDTKTYFGITAHHLEKSLKIQH